MLARPEKEVVVVSHGGFLQYLTESEVHHGWANAELRTYIFPAEGLGSVGAKLVEKIESREKRVVRKGLDHNESRQLALVEKK